MVRQRPFRFSVVVERAKSRDEWVSKAHIAEELGYDTFLVPDHIGKDIAPVAALMAATSATASLRIGSHVFNNDLRHPAILAKEAATLDMLSGGRFQFGLGAGANTLNYEQAGIQFDTPGVRLNRFEEALQIIKRLFTEDSVTFRGDYYTITNMKGLPRPVQKPHPPIYIGGGGKRVLSIAAREADIVGLVPKNGPKGLDMMSATAQSTAQKVEWVREAAGDRFNELELSCTVFIVIVTEDREHVAQQVASRFVLPREEVKIAGQVTLSAEQVLGSPQVLIGTVDQIIQNLQMRRELYGISSIEVLEERMEAFAPVVAGLAGT